MIVAGDQEEGEIFLDEVWLLHSDEVERKEIHSHQK
jgi:hypothetical protein